MAISAVRKVALPKSIEIFANRSILTGLLTVIARIIHCRVGQNGIGNLTSLQVAVGVFRDIPAVETLVRIARQKVDQIVESIDKSKLVLFLIYRRTLSRGWAADSLSFPSEKVFSHTLIPPRLPPQHAGLRKNFLIFPRHRVF